MLESNPPHAEVLFGHLPVGLRSVVRLELVFQGLPLNFLIVDLNSPGLIGHLFGIACHDVHSLDED